jgi:hypothetical protein
MPRPPANEEAVFAKLARQPKSALIEHLRAAFRKMTKAQRRAVFDEVAVPSRRRATEPSVDGTRLLREMSRFRRDSFSHRYYAPFMIDSKNFMHVPEATTAWCDRFARLTKDACKLTKQGDHARAARCFSILYELLCAMEFGDHNVVFAHELGGWLIPADEKGWLKAYMESLAATATPEQFATIVTPILWRDSVQSFAAEVYASATQVATPPQRAAMEAERIRKGVRIHGEPRGRRAAT